MRVEDVSFSTPVFLDHPPGWQSPSDVFASFTLAWALEVRERMRLSPHAPFAQGVRDRLPRQYRFDTLGELITSSGPTSAIGRLTTLCGAWQLFDLMNQKWQIREDDFHQYSELLAFVTGRSDRPSLFRDLGGNLSRCLLAVRVRRAFSDRDELDQSEEWFVTGDPRLVSGDLLNKSINFNFHPTAQDRAGRNDSPVMSLMLMHGPISVPVYTAFDNPFDNEFPMSIWSMARVTVDEVGPDRIIALHGDRLESLSDLLIRGGEKALRAQQEMSPRDFQRFNFWPGFRVSTDAMGSSTLPLASSPQASTNPVGTTSGPASWSAETWILAFGAVYAVVAVIVALASVRGQK